jgi:hypothetical protein
VFTGRSTTSLGEIGSLTTGCEKRLLSSMTKFL